MYTNKSMYLNNFTIRNSWSETQSAPSLPLSLSLFFFFFFADYVELLRFSCKEYNQFDFDINHRVISMCRVISCVVGRGYLLWPVHSLGKTVFAFVLLHFVFQGQTLFFYSRYLLTSYFCIPVPYDEKDFFFFFGISSRRSCKSS